MNRKNEYNRGFTLIEILIATTIFSVVISILFSSFKAFVISSQTVKEVVTQSEKIRNVYKFICRDLEGVYILQPPRYRKAEFNSDPDPYRFIGEETTRGQQVVSSMVFTSLAHAKFGGDQRDGIARIAYYLKENKNNLYDLYRADSLAPFPEEVESCFDPVLCSDIAGFEVTYKDVNGEEYKNWDSDDEAFNYTFPASIDIKFIFGSAEKQQESVFSIKLAAGREPIE